MQTNTVVTSTLVGQPSIPAAVTGASPALAQLNSQPTSRAPGNKQVRKLAPRVAVGSAKGPSKATKHTVAAKATKPAPVAVLKYVWLRKANGKNVNPARTSAPWVANMLACMLANTTAQGFAAAVAKLPSYGVAAQGKFNARTCLTWASKAGHIKLG